MLLAYQSQGQPAKQPMGKKFIPPIFGQWQTGEVLVGKREDNKSPVKRAVVVDAMTDALSLLPAGVLVNFRIGLDKVAHEPFYEMILIPPFPLESCRYGTLRYECIGEASNKRPDPNQKPVIHEFSLVITKQDVFDTFAAVGATTKDVSYRIRGNGHSWEGNYFVSKDRQTMWAEVYPGETYTLEPDGTKRQTELPAVTLQVYHRVPDATTPSSK